MGMADDTRRLNAAASDQVDEKSRRGAERFDLFLETLEAVMPDAAGALRQLGATPTHRAGLFKKGWPFFLAGVGLLLFPDGSWTFTDPRYKKQFSIADARADWINKSFYGATAMDSALKPDRVRADIQNQVKTHASK